MSRRGEDSRHGIRQNVNEDRERKREREERRTQRKILRTQSTARCRSYRQTQKLKKGNLKINFVVRTYLPKYE